MTALARLWRWLWSPFEWTAWNTTPTSDEARRHGRADGSVNLDAVAAERNSEADKGTPK